jgi:hypothetical protein
MTTKLKVRFDGKTLVPLEPVDLPAQSEWEVDIRQYGVPASESARKLLDAIWSSPKLDDQAMAEFDRTLANAKVVGSAGGIFDDLFDNDVD